MTKPKDLKEALSSGRKPDITHIRKSLLVYGARACEYGSEKYERSNFLREVEGGLGADFERYRAYLRACVSHVQDVLDAMEFHQATDPHLEDKEGMRRAAYSADTDVTPGSEVCASGLPHLCGAVASLNIAIEQAVRYGLLPADPGQPWKGRSTKAILDDLTDLWQEQYEAAPIAGHPPVDDRLQGTRDYLGFSDGPEGDDDEDDGQCVHRVPLIEYCKYCEL